MVNQELVGIENKICKLYCMKKQKDVQLESTKYPEKERFSRKARANK